MPSCRLSAVAGSGLVLARWSAGIDRWRSCERDLDSSRVGVARALNVALRCTYQYPTPAATTAETISMTMIRKQPAHHRSSRQLRATTARRSRRSGFTAMPSAAGTFGRPGIVMMSPAFATTKPAPAEPYTSLTVIRKPRRPAEPGRIVGQRVLRLRHAHRRVLQADRSRADRWRGPPPACSRRRRRHRPA